MRLITISIPVEGTLGMGRVENTAILILLSQTLIANYAVLFPFFPSVFKALPHLVLLDGYPRLPPDLEGSHSSASSSSSGSNTSIHSGTALCTIC